MIVCLGTTPALARTMRFASLDVGGVNRTSDVVEYAAGKATNVARAAMAMGADVLLLGLQGGPRGRMLLDALTVEGIAHAFVETRSPTRLCTTVIDDAMRSATELIEDAPPVTSGEGDSLLVLLRERLGRADTLVLSGSIARGLDAAFAARCVAIAHNCGARTIVDGSGEALRLAAREKPGVIKINAAELAGATSRPVDAERDLIAAMRDLQAATGGAVIVTRGVKPTLAFDGGDWFEASVPSVDVVSPIGCGDCFAAAIAMDGSLESGLRLATAMACANAETARSAVFERARADAIFGEVVVRRYNPAS
jgi:tagatose 6-phosphate kinase